MSNFDPYHKWLGIPPAEQPPHHYRLLSVPPFEADLEVIEAAADRQMTYVRQCATGPYMKESQQLLNELAAARVCLLNPAKKKTYDGELKARLAPTKSPETSTAISRPRVTRIPAKRQPDVDAGDDDEYSMVVLERPTGRGNLSLPPRRGRSKKNARPQPYLIWGGAAGLGLLLLWGLVHIITRPGDAANQPAANGLAASTPAEPAPAAANKPPPAAAKEPPAVAATELPPAPAGPPSTAERREIVERVLKLGGEVVVQTGEGTPWTAIKAIDDLPEVGTVKIQNLVLQAIAIEEFQSICRLAIDTVYLSQKGGTNNHLAVLGKAKGIRSLNLHSPSCTDGGLAHLARCPGLQEVALTQCDFTAAGWKHLRQIPEMTVFRAVYCNISDAHIASLAAHPRLATAVFESGNVTGAGFLQYRGTSHLEDLSFGRCPLDAAGVQAISKGLPELKSLSVGLISLTDDTVVALRDLKRLERLSLVQCGVTDAGLAGIVELGSLKYLNLDKAPVTGAGFRDCQGKLPDLESCLLNQAQLTDDGLRHLAAAAPRMHMLSVVGTAVTDAGLKSLKEMRGLKLLCLSKDVFSSAVVGELKKALPTCNVSEQ